MIKKPSTVRCSCGGEMRRTGKALVEDFTTTQFREAGVSPAAFGRDVLEQIVALNSCLLTGPLGSWECETCGKKEDGYTVFGRNLISIEPMKGHTS